MRRETRILLTVLAMAGGACGQHVTSPIDAGVDAGPSGECTSDSECPFGDTCAEGTCRTPPCVVGVSCTPTSNPCVQGVISCTTGAAVCKATSNPANEGKACAGTPPAPVCVGSSLQTSAAGACASGVCAFATTTTSCVAGCANGACETCTPMCGSSTCGNDGCGGSCGVCPANESCGGGGVIGQCGSSATVPAYPNVTPTQIDPGPAYGLRVSPDEAHLLVQRTPIYPGPLALGVVTLNAAGTQGTPVTLTTSVQNSDGFPQADFIENGALIYYVDDATTPPQLVVASPDGSNQKVIASGSIENFLQFDGETLVYEIESNDIEGVWAVKLPGGTPVSLPAPAGSLYPSVVLSPSGTAAVMGNDSNTAYELVQTATGAATPLGSMSPLILGLTWSPDGSHLAYYVETISMYALHVVDADGTGDTVLTTSGKDATPYFAPDGSFLAYGETNDTLSLSAVVVHPFGGAADITLTFDTAQTWYLLGLSPDGKLALLMSDSGLTMAAAPTTQSGSFVVIDTSASQLGQYSVSPNDAYAAIIDSARGVLVAPISGGMVTTLALPSDQLPFYEEVATNPQLLIFTSTTQTEEGVPGSVALFGAQGTGSGTVLPGAVLPAFTEAQAIDLTPFSWQGEDSGSGQVAEPFTWGWLGSEAVYETDRGQNGTPAFDVVAATDRGTTVGVIAPGALTWSVRNGATPTRVFFVKSDGSIWWSPLPQSP